MCDGGCLMDDAQSDIKDLRGCNPLANGRNLEGP